MLRERLEEHEWKITETAVSLGISRKNLWEKMKKYGIQVEQQ
ncbi:helix-turn-helix domain-containing protein [Thiolapillus sp.]|nr:helix-turn-helix domain-containing protein [Thiolapillus sp.]